MSQSVRQRAAPVGKDRANLRVGNLWYTRTYAPGSLSLAGTVDGNEVGVSLEGEVGDRRARPGSIQRTATRFAL